MTRNVKTETTRGASATAAGKRRAKRAGTPERDSGAAPPEGRKHQARARRAGGKGKSTATRPAMVIIRPKAGTKKDRLVSLLSTKVGADVAALSTALGWQAHTTRAALTRLRQAGFPLEAAKPAGGGATVYRITTEGTSSGCAG